MRTAAYATFFAIISLAPMLYSLSVLAAPTERKEPAKAALADPGNDVLDIVGYYTANSIDGKGNPYEGLVSIMRSGEIYLIRWLIQTESFAGIGIRRGDDLAVSWSIPQGERVIRGVTMYRIEAGKAGPTLKGWWLTVPGDGKVREETLRWLKAK